MPFIHLTTFIAAPVERVFDLSRSAGLHKSSMQRYQEEMVDGPMTGLLEEDDSVTWKAKHLFKERRMTVRITQMQRPSFFADEQIKGDFVSMKHEHYYKPVENGTIMIDQLRFETPRGFLGKILNRFYLEKYMTRLLELRNQAIKSAAESNQWKQFLNT